MTFKINLPTNGLSALIVTHAATALPDNYTAPFNGGQLEVQLTTGDTVQVFLTGSTGNYTVSYRVYEDGVTNPTQNFNEVIPSPYTYGAWSTVFTLASLPVYPDITLLALGNWETPAAKAMPMSFLPEANTLGTNDYVIGLADLGYGLSTVKIKKSTLSTSLGTGGSSATNYSSIDFFGITRAHSSCKAYSGEHANPMATSPTALITAGVSELSDASYANIWTRGGGGPSYTPAFSDKKAFFMFKVRVADLTDVSMLSSKIDFRPGNGITDSVAVGMWNGTTWVNAVIGPMTGNGTDWGTGGSAHNAPLTSYLDSNGYVWMIVASTTVFKTLELGYASLKLTGLGIPAQSAEPGPAPSLPLLVGPNPGGNEATTCIVYATRSAGAFPLGIVKQYMSIPTGTGFTALDMFTAKHDEAGNQYAGIIATSQAGSQMRVANLQATPAWTGLIISSELGEVAKITDKGVLFPPMTKAARNAITSPPNGLTIYQSDNGPGLRTRENGAWVKFTTVADP